MFGCVGFNSIAAGGVEGEDKFMTRLGDLARLGGLETSDSGSVDVKEVIFFCLGVLTISVTIVETEVVDCTHSCVTDVVASCGSVVPTIGC